jgi:uncharacterized protein YkwD
MASRIGIGAWAPGVAALATLVVLLCLVAASAGAEPAWAGCKHRNAGPREITSGQARDAVACLINKRRSRRDLRAVDARDDLNRAARRHSLYMREHGCFAHQCPGEGGLVGRLGGYLLGALGWGYGENIAWGEGRNGNPRKIVRGWMHSAGHRHNLLDPRWEHLGVGVVWGRPDRPRGDAGTYTADFGFRKG